MQNFTENTAMSWGIGNPNTSYIGDPPWTLPQVQEYYYNWYPIYYPSIVYEKSKVDIAFRILKVLQEKGLLNINKVKTFVELVDMIQKEL